MPEPRTITPEKPHCERIPALDTTPMSTLRCLKMRFSVTQAFDVVETAAGTGRTELVDVVDQGSAAGPGGRRPGGNTPRACANRTRARRTPSASRAPRSPTAAASGADVQGLCRHVQEVRQHATDLGSRARG